MKIRPAFESHTELGFIAVPGVFTWCFLFKWLVHNKPMCEKLRAYCLQVLNHFKYNANTTKKHL